MSAPLPPSPSISQHHISTNNTLIIPHSSTSKKSINNAIKPSTRKNHASYLRDLGRIKNGNVVFLVTDINGNAVDKKDLFKDMANYKFTTNITVSVLIDFLSTLKDKGKSADTIANYKSYICEYIYKPLSFIFNSKDTAELANQIKDYSLISLSHLFLILSWNIIGRSINIANLALELISFKDDGIFINFGITKTNQDASKNKPKHIYANPIMPSICPVLSLDIYFFSFVFSRSYTVNAANKLFSENAEIRFSGWLNKTILSENIKDSVIASDNIIDEYNEEADIDELEEFGNDIDIATNTKIGIYLLKKLN